MLDRPTSDSVHKTSIVCRCWLLVAVLLTAAYAVLAVLDLGGRFPAWKLGIGAVVAAVGWLVRTAEARVSAAVDRALQRAWWMGYATCLEDRSADPCKVLPLRRDGDKISDTVRTLNGYEGR